MSRSGRLALLVLLAALPAAGQPLKRAAGIGVESAALLLSGQQGGEIPFTALALPVAGEDGKAHVLVRLRLDGPALLEGQTEGVLRVETALYALGTGGGVLGSDLGKIEIDLTSQREAVETGGVDLLAGLDLKPGAYTLRILAKNLETGHLGVRSLPLPIPDVAQLEDASGLTPAPPADPRPTLRAANLGPLDPPPFPDDPISQTAATVPPAPLPVVPDTAEGRKLRAAVRAAFREALSRLAAGREAEALTATAALEDGLLARKESPVTAEQIVEIEAGAARELVTAAPASCAPLLRFHQRLYEEASLKRRLQGTTLARQSAGRLLDLCRQAGPPGLAHRFAAVFGVELARGGVSVQGGQMLQAALAEEPQDEGILLELAAGAERRGASTEALTYLDSLLTAQPDHREARLRRILDRARAGAGEDAEDAEAALGAYVQEETGGWRLSLAYQELARLQMARKLSAALATLREGLGRLPGDEKLTLLLAALLDRTGQGSEARQLLARFKPPAGSEGGGAARRRYSQPPLEPFATRNRELGEEAAAHRPALAGALEKTAP